MLLFLFLFGLALGAVSSADDHGLALGAVSPDDPQFTQQQVNGTLRHSFNGRTYTYFAKTMTWADAEFHCVSQGDNLVSIHSLAEHNYVKFMIKNFDPTEGFAWIGLNDLHKEGRWMWSDGTAANFLSWSNGEPNNSSGKENCVQMNFSAEKKWNDVPCSRTYAFVCASRI